MTVLRVRVAARGGSRTGYAGSAHEGSRAFSLCRLYASFPCSISPTLRGIVSSTAVFRVGARLSRVTTMLLFGLIVLGSVVRTAGSGLACPDRPLRQRRTPPSLD